VPSRNLLRRIRDILEMGAEIESFIAGMSFANFQQDPKTVKAVLYNLSIIGEAASQLLRAIRNVIIHEYFRVNLNIIWETIKTDLPPLMNQLQELLENS